MNIGFIYRQITSLNVIVKVRPRETDRQRAIFRLTYFRKPLTLNQLLNWFRNVGVRGSSKIAIAIG